MRRSLSPLVNSEHAKEHGAEISRENIHRTMELHMMGCSGDVPVWVKKHSGGVHVSL